MKTKLLVLLVFFGLVMLECSDPTSEHDVDVYVSGNDDDLALSWKNGKVTELVRTTRPNDASNASDLFVSDGSVRIVGTVNATAKCWECNANLNTGLCRGPSGGYDVFVHGTDEYVVGYCYINGFNRAVYWKNGEPIQLAENMGYSLANSIYVQGSDVYATGSIENIGNVYWKNGVPTVVENAVSLSSIFVNGSDIFIAGTSNKGAAYWRNRTVMELDGDGTSEIIVNNNDVYVSGYKGDYAVYWKNGFTQLLTDGKDDATANSLFVLDDDVYVAGLEGDFAMYWKNGVPTKLGVGYATSIHAEQKLN